MSNILTKAYILLFPGLEVNEAALVKLGMVNCFIGDEEYDGNGNSEGGKKLFLLFKDADQILLGKIMDVYKSVDEYDVGEYTMMVMDWPSEWDKEWDFFIKGAYSKFSDKYKERFGTGSKAPPLAEKNLGKIASPGWLIIHKHHSLRELQEEKIGQPLEDWQEVASIIDKNKEVFQYNRYKKIDDEYNRSKQDKKGIS